jgi:hypothetical protein
MRCSGLANGTTSKMRSCFYSRERLTLKRRKHDFVGKVLPHHSRTSEQKRQRHAGPSFPHLQVGALWPNLGKGGAL